MLNLFNLILMVFLNPTRADQRPVRAWFLDIAFIQEVGMHVCVSVCVCVCPPPGYLKPFM